MNLKDFSPDHLLAHRVAIEMATRLAMALRHEPGCDCKDCEFLLKADHTDFEKGVILEARKYAQSMKGRH